MYPIFLSLSIPPVLLILLKDQTLHADTTVDVLKKYIMQWIYYSSLTVYILEKRKPTKQ